MKINRNVCKLLGLSALLVTTCLPQGTISYQVPGGRLGDCLVVYAKAAWISHKYSLTLMYKPFKFSEHLMLSTTDAQKNMPSQKSVLTSQEIENQQNLNQNFCSNLYFMDAAWDKEYNQYIPYMRHDKKFVEFVQKRIAPKYSIDLIIPPQDMISVAVHVRRGSGPDGQLLMEQPDRKNIRNKKGYLDYRHPLKCPPNSYYIEQLKKIIAMIPDQNIYIFVFTDDKDPKALCDVYKKALGDADTLIFDYRKADNKDSDYVIQDLFSMTNFDCLVRSDSAFSQIAHLIGNYKIVFWPEQCFWDDTNTLHVTKVGTEINTED